MSLNTNATFEDFLNYPIPMADGSTKAVRDFPPHALIYNVGYGWRQATTDKAAGLRKELTAEGKLTSDEIEAAIVASKQVKEKAIIDGTIGVRKGGSRAPAKSLFEKALEIVTLQKMEKAAAKAKQALPKKN